MGDRPSSVPHNPMHPSSRHLIVLVLAGLLALPAAAAGHAVAGAKAPAPNAWLAAAPASVRVSFSERVNGTPDALTVVNAAGTRVSGPATIRAKVVTAPLTTTAPGRYAYAYSVESLDGHIIGAAYAFSVRVRTPAARPVSLVLAGRSVRLSGGRVGVRTLRLWPGAGAGTVRWTSPLLAAPFIWNVRNGAASGLLPFPGTYTVETRIRTGTFSELIATGTAVIEP